MRLSTARLAGALLLIGLAGCDATDVTGTPLVPPTAPPSTSTPPPSAPAAVVRNAYIKGALVFQVGTLEHYRSEIVTGAAEYVWTTSGDGEVEFGDPGYGSTRYVTAQATTEGAITFHVTAYNAAGEVIGRGNKTLTITP